MLFFLQMIDFKDFEQHNFEQWQNEALRAANVASLDVFTSTSYNELTSKVIHIAAEDDLHLPQNVQNNVKLWQTEFQDDFSCILDFTKYDVMLKSYQITSLISLEINNLLNNNDKENILVKICIDSSFFEEIAKFKVIKSIVSAYKEDCPNCQVAILAIPSEFNKSVYDYHNNLIRQTLEVSSAIIGGADFIYIPPFSYTDSDFDRVFSENTFRVLTEESHLNFFDDICHGSYYINDLTTQLFEKVQKTVEFYTDKDIHTVIGEFFKSNANSLEVEYEKYYKGTSKLIGTNIFNNHNDKYFESSLANNYERIAYKYELLRKLIESKGSEILSLNSDNLNKTLNNIYNLLLNIGITPINYQFEIFEEITNFIEIKGIELVLINIDNKQNEEYYFQLLNSIKSAGEGNIIIGILNEAKFTIELTEKFSFLLDEKSNITNFLDFLIEKMSVNMELQ